MRAGWIFALTLALWGAALARDGFDRWVARTELPVTLAETSVTVHDRDGRLMRVYPVADGIWRLPVALDQVDPGFVNLLIRYEDKRFWSHHGVDPVALIRAAGQAALRGGIVSGGSTLTMQVARLLEDGTTGRWSGKLRQMRVALALERRLNKAQILTLYLTHAPYGGNIEGIHAASRIWLGKSAARLTPSDAALLVALPQSPTQRRPDRHSARAKQSRDRVLHFAQTHGIYTPQSVAAALHSPVPETQTALPRLAPHLADRLRAQHPHRARFDLTLNADLQRVAEQIIQRAARAYGPNMSAAALIADHETGEILASIGSPGYGSDHGGYIDMTQALRSPGSTLKPVVYGLGIDQGLIHPDTLIHDGPVQFGRYAPHNFDGQFRGDVTIRSALQLSLNIPVVRLMADLGPERLMTALRKGGMHAQLPGGKPGLAVALGGVGVSLHDLVQLYAVMAQGGQGRLLHSDLLAKHRTSQRVLSDVAAWQIADILRDVPPPPHAPRRKLAFKTGTSYGHRDAWAVGWDGQHVIGVWLGRPDGTAVPGAFGGERAAPVLFELFAALKTDFAPFPAPPPSTLISGPLPAPLQRYGTRNTPNGSAAPQVTFPPDGSRFEHTDTIALKLRGGQSPFTILANQIPIRTELHRRELELPVPEPGFWTYVVIDKTGQSDRVTVHITP